MDIFPTIQTCPIFGRCHIHDSIKYPTRKVLQPENTILVGPYLDLMNQSSTLIHFKNPLVCELLKFCEGIDMSMNKNMNKTVCCALVCVACGIPARRKVCGF